MPDSVKPVVGIVMGSDSDLSVMKGAADVLEQFGVPFEILILSAHRSPDRAAEFARTARDRGLQVIVAGAGMAAHLAGAMAAHSSLPVIGVPLKAKSSGLAGADALYATVQMPPGVPVATVGIGGAKNAGHLAVRILAVADTGLAGKIDTMRGDMDRAAAARSDKLAEMGIDAYLQGKAEGK